MRSVVTMPVAALALLAAVPCSSSASAACDELVSRIIADHLRPAIEAADCAVVEKAGIDKKDHKLKGVCYESTGPTSSVRVDAQMSCHSGDESVASKFLGSKNAPGFDENVVAVAQVRGADCHLLDVVVTPSGEGAKLLAKLFDAKGKARSALEEGLAAICKPR